MSVAVLSPAIFQLRWRDGEMWGVLCFSPVWSLHPPSPVYRYTPLWLENQNFPFVSTYFIKVIRIIHNWPNHGKYYIFILSFLSLLLSGSIPISFTSQWFSTWRNLIKSNFDPLDVLSCFKCKNLKT